ncbi:MAG: T9SS type A sorting domain-containing protein [Saprospiraceae bacterium]|nr:T9SS type A sorting domain-containing protein [Saprospiraceae bacterium]
MKTNTWNAYNPVSFQIWATPTNQVIAGIYTSTGAYAIIGQKNLVSDYWNHLAVTYANDGSANNFKLLLNGQVIASATATGDLPPSSAMWFLGSLGGGFSGHVSNGFLGSVDELRFWDVARTPSQIRQARFSRLSGNEEGLEAYYNFNAVSPFGEVTDLTGNGYTGHLMYKEESVATNITDIGARFTYTQSVSSFTFLQQSNGGETFQWDFGNGTQSALVNPAVIYNTPGVYTVCLNVFGNGMYDTYCEEVEVKGIDRISPTIGGNTDYVTLYVYGGGFNANHIVKLRRAGFDDIVVEQTLFDAKKTLTALLNLDGQSTGVWDLVVANGPQETVLPGAFQIVAGEKAAPYVLFNGGGTILVNRWMPQTIKLGNSSNVDAHGVLLWVTIPDEPGNDIAFLNLNVKAPQLAIDNGYEEDLEALGYYIAVDSLFGKPNHSRVYTFYFPILPAKSSFDIMVRVKIGQGGGSVPMNVWVSEPFYQSPLSAEVQACVALSIAKACIKGGLGFIPGVPCITGTLAVVSDYLNDQPPTPSAYENIDTRSWFWILGTNLLECGVSLAPGGNVYAGILGLITSGVENGQENADCYRGFRQIGWLDILYYPVFNLDPNAKNGLPGYTPEGYIGAQSRMGYQIQFENKNTATAPAQEVVILDTLTFSKIDLTNFSFGAFGWGDTILSPLPGSKEFGIDVDLRPEKNLIVRVTGELDEVEKIVKWRFLSLDPATMDLTFDPLGGFLPPNLTPPEGEGFVTFTTGISDDIENDESVENRASIVFDLNEPILTNLHKNTFDLAAPTSELSASVASTTDTLVNLSVSSFDGESQVRHVEIWVSENDSAYVFYQRTSGNEVVFDGKPGYTYKFYSIAADSVGNWETEPDFPDVVVSILVGTTNLLHVTEMRLYPIPANNLLTLEMNITESSNLLIKLEDGLGRNVQTLYNGNLQAGWHRLPLRLEVTPGIYFLYISDGTGSKTEKIVILR